MKNLFRLLLVATVISVVASGLVYYFYDRYNLPIELQNYLHNRRSDVLSSYNKIFTCEMVLGFVLSTISFIGLYFFWRPARVLYCMSIAIGILIGLDPHYGPEVLPQLEGLLDNINSILSGVILCLIFTPPIKQLFANKTVAQ